MGIRLTKLKYYHIMMHLTVWDLRHHFVIRKTCKRKRCVTEVNHCVHSSMYKMAAWFVVSHDLTLNNGFSQGNPPSVDPQAVYLSGNGVSLVL